MSDVLSAEEVEGFVRRVEARYIDFDAFAALARSHEQLRAERDAWKQTVVARTMYAASVERRAAEAEALLARVVSYRKYDPGTAHIEQVRAFDADHDAAEAFLSNVVVSAASLAAGVIHGGFETDEHTFDVAAARAGGCAADALRPFADFPPITTAQRNRGYISSRIDPAWIDAARDALAAYDRAVSGQTAEKEEA